MCTTSHRLSPNWYRTPYNQSKGVRYQSGECLCEVVHVIFLEYEWCEDSEYIRVGAGAGKNVMFEQRVPHLGGRAIADQAEQQAHALDPEYRAHNALFADLRLAGTHVGEQVLGQDALYGRSYGSGSDWTAAEG